MQTTKPLKTSTLRGVDTCAELCAVLTATKKLDMTVAQSIAVSTSVGERFIGIFG
jgi:hypothetical protein